MNINYKDLTTEQRSVAIQRLTALWAFSESGLGGIMHALQIPFTGLAVGGLAIIMICFIAHVSDQKYGQILRSLLIVLVIKAMVSPYTPFPAYIAVSFQALMGFVLFSLFRVNLVSILLLSIITMLESALQQLLILTLFFGQSIWKATDAFVAFIAKQFNLHAVNGSQWIIGIYLAIYLVGAICVTWITRKTIAGFESGNAMVTGLNSTGLNRESFIVTHSNKKNSTRKLWILIGLLVLLSVVLFFVAADTKQGWIAVLKMVCWTLSSILIWFMIINPLFTKFIKQFLHKKEGRYSEEVSRVLSFLPVLRQLTAGAWTNSRSYKGWTRWSYFLSTLVHWSLTYENQPLTGSSFKKTA